MSTKKPRTSVTYESEAQQNAIKAHCEKLGMSVNAFILEAIEKAMNGSSVSNCDALLPEDRKFTWFTTAKGEKLEALKDGLGIDANAEEIILTEQELMAKATELSGISYESICKEGRRYQAQKLITSSLNTGADTQGRLGAADRKLAESYIQMMEEALQGTYSPRNGLISVTVVGQWMRPVTNYNTVNGWVKRFELNELLETHADVSGRGNQGLKISWLKENPGFIDKTREKLGL